jgi:sporulation protein YlmC with PRC-barrel domain
MEIGREILDQQLVDRNGHYIGKVDGIVLELPG